ncbi:LysM peptidoglycan-binding domain-containing protein [Aridibaculum aurantiacum]|uniref:LysM peptidoglycan-binding domain-containing protein n=1 Tax=Aridibaculum aurantiacum TaxID=2810307 RepID=UPI001A973E5F|nr:LysM peptidoglycan-binding domain-containing protein [Aridibaculum aurantiacum]
MKKLLFTLLFFYTTSLFAQKANVLVEGITPNLYLTHIVSPKENFYSIGRIYNQHPKAIASFNHTTLEKGLAIGQTLKIPLTPANFDVTGAPTPDETLVPVYHVVTKNETLFRIGNNHATPLENLRQWNKLSSDVIEVGAPLVVGNLRVKKEHETAFRAIPASDVKFDIVATTAATTAPVAGVVTQETVAAKPADEAQEQKETVKPVSEQPVAKAADVVVPPASETVANTAANDTIKQVEIIAEKAAVTEKPAVAEKTEPVAVVTEKKQEEPVVEKVQPKDAPVQAPSTSVSTSSMATAGGVASDEGAFSPFYNADAADKSLVNKAGDAGTFKSTSGWQDKKYYVLMNDIPAGTIVKISSTQDKVIYAKVLGALPETKESNNMLLRMNNAAANYLGIIDPKFPVQVTYYQ